jgi:hypothetical protein
MTVGCGGLHHPGLRRTCPNGSKQMTHSGAEAEAGASAGAGAGASGGPWPLAKGVMNFPAGRPTVCRESLQTVGAAGRENDSFLSMATGGRTGSSMGAT